MKITETQRKFVDDLDNEMSKIDLSMNLKLNIWETVSSSLKPFINKIKKNKYLDNESKEKLLSFIYSNMYEYSKQCRKTFIDSYYNKVSMDVRHLLKQKFGMPLGEHLNTTLPAVLNEKIKSAATEAKQRNKHTEEKKVEEEKAEAKKYKFIDLKNIVLKRLGYVQNKQGSQDDSKDIEKWMLENSGTGITKTIRNFLIKDVQQTKNDSQLLALLKQNRLELKGDHLVRGR